MTDDVGYLFQKNTCTFEIQYSKKTHILFTPGFVLVQKCLGETASSNIEVSHVSSESYAGITVEVETVGVRSFFFFFRPLGFFAIGAVQMGLHPSGMEQLIVHHRLSNSSNLLRPTS